MGVSPNFSSEIKRGTEGQMWVHLNGKGFDLMTVRFTRMERDYRDMFRLSSIKYALGADVPSCHILSGKAVLTTPS